MFTTLLACVKTKFQILREAASTLRKRTLYKMKYPKDVEIFRDDSRPELDANLYSELRHCAIHLDSLLWYNQ
ncbi:hypothetical protein NQ318_004005 [Aromia moschata]|uniref:Uncharacterized protein n=1 Tax=Aromia moschata TaxID=1265417 RepID=A0AAV8Z7V2_9CUCU|nr:hypothetical protein NQ318_004005 [Aromia moschata]